MTALRVCEESGQRQQHTACAAHGAVGCQPVDTVVGEQRNDLRAAVPDELRTRDSTCCPKRVASIAPSASISEG
jgi:hypothetical protein